MAESPPTLKACQFESLRKCPSPSRCNSKQTWYSRRPPNALKAPPGGAKDSEMSDSPRKGVGNGVLHSKLGMGLGVLDMCALGALLFGSLKILILLGLGRVK